MQEREEVFEFVEKPKVTKAGDPSTSSTSSGQAGSGQGKWVITFASKGKCDATVSIVDKDGKIIRHLASGVLGVNAPWPFQQNSLAQKIEWDGLKDDFSKADVAGCKVKVGLGLGAKFERNIAWDPHLIGTIHWQEKNVLTAAGPDGSRYVGGAVGTVFSKDGNYLRTFWPPPAAEAEKVMTGQGCKFATTTWGDKVMVCSWAGPFTDKKQLSAVLMAQPGAGEVKEGPAPADLHRPQLPTDGIAWYIGYNPRITVDPSTEEIYVKFCQNSWRACRFNGRTGELDKAWPLHGKGISANELDIGPDGLLYIVTGNHGYSKAISRVGRDGKAVPFKDESEQMDPSMKVIKDEWQIEGSAKIIGAQKVLVTGVSAHSNTHDKGFDVSPAFGGRMLLVVENAFKPGWDAKYGVPAGGKGLAVQVWDTDGRLITANAVGVAPHWWRHGARMDRDGNLYLVVGGNLPAGQAGLDGIADLKAGGGGRIWGTAGTLVKFRYQGKFPTGGISGIKDAPADALKLTSLAVTGAHWAYGGVPNSSASNDCTCNHNRFDLDGFARSWIPANQLYSVMVLDANGNRIARLGRYGNVDDSEADLKEKKDGLRFAWPRATAVSDTAIYVIDDGNRRILKAALSYAAEETVPLP
jgi:hypothetical protein